MNEDIAQVILTEVRELAKSINGNGVPGIKQRVTRLETIVKAVGYVVATSIAIVGLYLAAR